MPSLFYAASTYKPSFERTSRRLRGSISAVPSALSFGGRGASYAVWHTEVQHKPCEVLVKTITALSRHNTLLLWWRFPSALTNFCLFVQKALIEVVERASVIRLLPSLRVTSHSSRNELTSPVYSTSPSYIQWPLVSLRGFISPKFALSTWQWVQRDTYLMIFVSLVRPPPLGRGHHDSKSPLHLRYLDTFLDNTAYFLRKIFHSHCAASSLVPPSIGARGHACLPGQSLHLPGI